MSRRECDACSRSEGKAKGEGKGKDEVHEKIGCPLGPEEN